MSHEQVSAGWEALVYLVRALAKDAHEANSSPVVALVWMIWQLSPGNFEPSVHEIETFWLPRASVRLALAREAGTRCHLEVWSVPRRAMNDLGSEIVAWQQPKNQKHAKGHARLITGWSEQAGSLTTITGHRLCLTKPQT